MFVVSFQALKWLNERVGDIPENFPTIFKGVLPELSGSDVVIDRNPPNSLLCIAILFCSEKSGGMYRASPERQLSPGEEEFLDGLLSLEAHMLYGDKVPPGRSVGFRKGGVLVLEPKEKKKRK